MAIISELKVEFDNGLNIITGETGAGKSLIIKAIQFLLGKRFSPEVLRTGSDTLIIEGEFIKDKSKTVIRRLFRNNGQSKSFINDEPVKQKDLIQTTRMLADLHGQHDHQNLLDANTHLKYLDSFGSYKTELNKVEQLFQKRESTKNTLNKLIKQQQEFEEKGELYEFQLKELILHPISINFEQEMTNKYKLLSKASDIKASLSNAGSLLEDGDSAVIKKLNTIMSELDKVSDYDDAILGLYKRIGSNRIDLEDLILEIQRVQENIVVNTDELERINEVISHIEMLKRKHGGSIASVVE
jgi:DNA repair protein RecN (Recombination protein N)